MKLLITNDDGIFSPGIKALIKGLNSYGEILVVAPDQERSGVGHGITVNHPLRIEQVQLFQNVERSFMVDGTPADCVKLAIEGLGFKPDLIISGINIGTNLGTDVFYSGTVSAAMEGAFNRIPSVAISLSNKEADLLHLDTAVHFLIHLLFKLKIPFHNNKLINVNVPALAKEQVQGIKATKLGLSRYENQFNKRLDPRGRPYYWMEASPINQDNNTTEDDYSAVELGFVSVTPIKLELTDYDLLPGLQKKLED